MSVLGEINVSKLSTATSSTSIKVIINSLFWNWYNSQDPNSPLFKVNILPFIHKTVRLKDLKPVFELIFGPPNELVTKNPDHTSILTPHNG